MSAVAANLRPRVGIAVEAYFPDEGGTPFLMTQLARAMARGGASVSVITSTPGAEIDDESVRVLRIGAPRMTNRRLLLRGLRMLHSATLIARRTRALAPNVDVLYVVAGPTLLSAFVALAIVGLRRPPRLVCVVHDLYPDAAVAGGALRHSGVVATAWRLATRFALKRSAAIIALGDDMRRRIQEAYKETEGRISVIPHWSVGESIQRIEREDSSELRRNKLSGFFVVQYAGNIGLTHGLAAMLEGARHMSQSSEFSKVRFVFFGGGAATDLVQEAEAESSSIVRYLGVRPRTAQTDFLGCADVAVIGYAPGMVGVSVPSRTPSVLAAGRPIIAISDNDSDLARLVAEKRLGWVVKPGDSHGFLQAVRAAMNLGPELASIADRVVAQSRELESVATAADRYISVAVGD